MQQESTLVEIKDPYGTVICIITCRLSFYRKIRVYKQHLNNEGEAVAIISPVMILVIVI